VLLGEVSQQIPQAVFQVLEGDDPELLEDWFSHLPLDAPHVGILAPKEEEPHLVALLADLGYDREMGARPLKRIIQQKVEDALSDQMLAGKFEDGDTIVVDVEEEEIILRRSQGEPAEAKETIAAG